MWKYGSALQFYNINKFDLKSYMNLPYSFVKSNFGKHIIRDLHNIILIR